MCPLNYLPNKEIIKQINFILQEQSNLRWEPIVFEDWLHGGQPQGHHWIREWRIPTWLALPCASGWMCEQNNERSKTHTLFMFTLVFFLSRLIDFLFLVSSLSLLSLLLISLPPSITHSFSSSSIRKRSIPWTRIPSCCEELTRPLSLLPLPLPHQHWPSRHQVTAIITDMDMDTPAQLTLTPTIIAIPHQDTISIRISINISLI